MSKILIVEDDRIISSGLSQALKAAGDEVICSFNGDDGLDKIRTESPDLVILDIMIPEMNGFELITEVRRQGNTVPVIVLSARIEARDKIRGLDLGADDYVTKPFDLNELMARIRRHLNRNNLKTEIFGDFIYDWQQRVLMKNNKNVSLNGKERKLLEFFLKSKGQIISREQILDAVWGDDYEGTDRTVDNSIVSLRKVIGSKHLITERGLGYRFVTKP